MNKRLLELWDWIDLKSILGAILLVSIALLLYIYLPNVRDRVRAYRVEKYQGRTTGKVLLVEKIDRMSQGKYGTKVYTDSYQINYEYAVGELVFQGIDMVPVGLRNQKLLGRILTQSDSALIIKFDVEHPEKSVIISDD